jgi:hypothetical protein
LKHIFRGQESTEASYTEISALLKKYENNPNIYDNIFQYTYEGKKYSPRDWFKLNKENTKFAFNDANLKKLKQIDARIE